MTEPIASPPELSSLLGQDVDESRAYVLLSLAQDLCSTIVSPVPPAARSVVLGVAARAYTNPQNAQSETVGPYAVNFGPASGGLYLTKQDRSMLRRVAGRSGAFSVNLIPPGAGVSRLPGWDRNGYLQGCDVTGQVTGALNDFFYDNDGNPTMAYTPPSMNLTQITGSIIPVTASGTLALGRESEVSGTAAVSLAFSTTVNGAVAGVKVAETYTGSGVTVTGTFLGGATSFTMVAGQENKFTWDGAAILVS